MHHDFWHDRWTKQEIGFHEGQVNALLARYFSALALPQQARVFIPLCGKAVDIEWIASQDCEVIGVEFNESAVEQFFAERNLSPNIKIVGDHVCYSYENIRLFVGDFFALTPEQLGHIDAVYDRAAMVALPPEIRQRYVRRLPMLTEQCPMLLITFVYDQSALSGPPFSIDMQEIEKHYSHHFSIKCLKSVALEDGLKGKVSANEQIVLLQSK